MRKTYETRRHVVVGETTIHVVERTRVSAHQVGDRVWFLGQKDFTSIVVDGPDGTRTFVLNDAGQHRPTENAGFPTGLRTNRTIDL